MSDDRDPHEALKKAKALDPKPALPPTPVHVTEEERATYRRVIASVNRASEREMEQALSCR